MEKLVENTEALCEAFENLPRTLTDRICVVRFFGDHSYLSIPATIANIRLYYYVKQDHYPSESTRRGFETLRFILTDPRSGWNDLSDDDKIYLLRKQVDVTNEVFVFSS